MSWTLTRLNNIDERENKMKYQILSSADMVDLEILVCDSMKLGWKPQGSICVCIYEGFRSYYQAMVRE